MLEKLLTLFTSNTPEDGLGSSPRSDIPQDIVIHNPLPDRPVLKKSSDATNVDAFQSCLVPVERIQTQAVHSTEDGAPICSSLNVMVDSSRPSISVDVERRRQCEDTEAENESTSEEQRTKRQRQSKAVEPKTVMDADILDSDAMSAELLVQLHGTTHMPESVVGGRSHCATPNIVADGVRLEAPAEISSENESSEDRSAKQQRHSEYTRSELPAEIVDVDDSDDELVCFATEGFSKKDVKARKKRALESEKEKKKERKRQEKFQEKEKKKAKKQQKLEKRERAEREALKRAKQDKKIAAEQEALERASQQRQEAMEVQLRREAEEEARCKADAVARRFALRLDLYDAGVPSEIEGKKQLAPLRPKRPPIAKAAPPVIPPLSTDPQPDAPASDPVMSDEDVALDAETQETPQMPEPDAPDGDDQPPLNFSLADAVAEAPASPSKDTEPTSCFASFETFDAQAAYAKAHAKVKEPEPLDSRAKYRKLAKPQKILLPEEFFSLQDLPQELKPEVEFNNEPAIYVAHFVRWALGAWQRCLQSGEELSNATLTQEMVIFRDKAKLHETRDAVAPLLRRLRSKDFHKEVLQQLLSIVRLVAKRSYATAISEYVDTTMGKKTWHQSMSQMQMQQNHGGSIARILKQSPLLGFDWDPVVQRYSWALKRLIHFAQCIRPPEIASERA